MNSGRVAPALHRRGRRASGVVLTTALAFTACGDGREDVPDPGRGDPADIGVDRFLEQASPDGTSGTLVAARHGEMIHCEGFGMADREAQLRATCDTVYDVMSMTKQFTAAAILKLEMMGKLKVSDPIDDYLGPVPADKRKITLHQLLTHTSGLIDALGDDYARQTRKSMLTAAFESKLQTRPGAEYHYSNLGYSVLAAIIEKVSGTGYEQFLAEHLFAPARMTDTGYVLPEWRPDQVAVEYDPRGEPQGRPFEHPWGHDGPYWNLRGNGGLLSTARDMLLWHLALEGNEVPRSTGQREAVQALRARGARRRHLLRIRLGNSENRPRQRGLAQRRQRLVLRRGGAPPGCRGDDVLDHQPEPGQHRRLEPRAARAKADTGGRQPPSRRRLTVVTPTGTSQSLEDLTVGVGEELDAADRVVHPLGRPHVDVVLDDAERASSSVADSGRRCRRRRSRSSFHRPVDDADVPAGAVVRFAVVPPVVADSRCVVGVGEFVAACQPGVTGREASSLSRRNCRRRLAEIGRRLASRGIDTGVSKQR